MTAANLTSEAYNFMPYSKTLGSENLWCKPKGSYLYHHHNYYYTADMQNVNHQVEANDFEAPKSITVLFYQVIFIDALAN